MGSLGSISRDGFVNAWSHPALRSYTASVAPCDNGSRKQVVQGTLTLGEEDPSRSDAESERSQHREGTAQSDELPGQLLSGDMVHAATYGELSKRRSGQSMNDDNVRGPEEGRGCQDGNEGSAADHGEPVVGLHPVCIQRLGPEASSGNECPDPCADHETVDEETGGPSGQGGRLEALPTRLLR